MPPRHTIRQVVGTYRRKAFGTGRRAPYPPAAGFAFYGMLEIAEEQPVRGVFESEALLRLLLAGPKGRGRIMARQVPFLIAQGDLVCRDDGSLAVDGWPILQEGAEPITARMEQFNGREHRALTGAERTAAYRARRAAAGVSDVTSVTSDGVTVTSQTSHPDVTKCDDGDGDVTNVTTRAGDMRVQRRGEGEGEGEGGGAGRARPYARGMTSVGQVLGSSAPPAATEGKR